MPVVLSNDVGHRVLLYGADGSTLRQVVVDSSGRLVVVGPGASGALTVSATDLDIRNLAKTLDELYAVLRTDAGVTYDARQVVGLDGATDRRFAVDASGQLLMGGRRFHGACYNLDQTVSSTTDVDVVTYASAVRARVLAFGLAGAVVSYNDVTVLLYTYDSAGNKSVIAPAYSDTIAMLLEKYNPFYDAATAFVPNTYHVYRYVAAYDWNMRIIFSNPLTAYYGFGLRLVNATAASRRFYGSCIYEVES